MSKLPVSTSISLKSSISKYQNNNHKNLSQIMTQIILFKLLILRNTYFKKHCYKEINIFKNKVIITLTSLFTFLEKLAFTYLIS